MCEQPVVMKSSCKVEINARKNTPASDPGSMCLLVIFVHSRVLSQPLQLNTFQTS